MANEGKAFVKGGAGCLLVFLALGALALVFGGWVRLNPAGLVLLFLLGGVVGLVVNWIYQRGKRDAEK